MSPFPCDFGLQVSTDLCRNAELRTHDIKYFNVDPTSIVFCNLYETL